MDNVFLRWSVKIISLIVIVPTQSMILNSEGYEVRGMR